jgi:hypothetical protein
VSGFATAKDWAGIGGGVRFGAWTNGAIAASLILDRRSRVGAL